MEKGWDIWSQVSIKFLQQSPAGSNRDLSLSAYVEHIYAPQNITRRKLHKNILLNELQDHPRGQRSVLEPGQYALEEFSAGISVVCLLAKQPFTHPAPTESLQTPRTLTSAVPFARGKGQLFRGAIFLNKIKATLEKTKRVCVRFSRLNVGAVWATSGYPVWSPVAALQWGCLP